MPIGSKKYVTLHQKHITFSKQLMCSPRKRLCEGKFFLNMEFCNSFFVDLKYIFQFKRFTTDNSFCLHLGEILNVAYIPASLKIVTKTITNTNKSSYLMGSKSDKYEIFFTHSLTDLEYLVFNEKELKWL